jgi:hypothetical protein
MDVREALTDLVDLSPGLGAAVAFDAAGRLAGSTLDDEERAATVAEAARRLLDEASALRDGPHAEQVAALTRAGGLVVVTGGGLVVAAVTVQPGPPAGLALHDLHACLVGLTADEGADAPR